MQGHRRRSRTGNYLVYCSVMSPAERDRDDVKWRPLRTWWSRWAGAVFLLLAAAYLTLYFFTDNPARPIWMLLLALVWLFMGVNWYVVRTRSKRRQQD